MLPNQSPSRKFRGAPGWVPTVMLVPSTLVKTRVPETVTVPVCPGSVDAAYLMSTLGPGRGDRGLGECELALDLRR